MPETSSRPVLRIVGYAAGGTWLVVILLLGLFLQGLTPEVKPPSPDDPIATASGLKNEDLIQDQNEAMRIVKVTRKMYGEYDWVMDKYSQIRSFTPPEDSHLTLDNIQRFIQVYDDFVREVKIFRRDVVGEQPGLYRVIAAYGMIKAFYKFTLLKAEVSHQVTEEEFLWTRDRLLEAALFAAHYTLENESLPEDQKTHLAKMREAIVVILEEKNPVDDPEAKLEEKVKRFIATVPRHNLELFLDNYVNVNYQDVHFTFPTQIQFNREAILAAAASNPP